MRERLIAGFVLVALFTLLAFGVIRAYALQQLIGQTQELRADRAAAVVATRLTRLQEEDQPVTRRLLEGLVLGDEKILYDAGAGRRLVAGDPHLSPAGDLVGSARTARGASVTIVRDRSVVDAAISAAVLPVVVVAGVLVAVAALLGYAVARRLSRPFQELARIARDLGRGRFDVEVPRYAIPEADTVGRALATSAAQLHTLVVRERDFAANASHQLRTPITALRLELEDLSLGAERDPGGAEQLHRALAELDRLNASVTNLLDLARGRTVATTDVDVSALIEEAATRWSETAARQRRTVSAAPYRPLRLRLAPGPIEQVLDVLLDNALTHGSGAVTLDVGEFDEHVRVRVTDEGALPAGENLFRTRHDDREDAVIGLADASRIADALGGHLTLERGPATVFSLMLPRTAPVTAS
ncbi:MAG: sensor histidine kinase [Nocardioidaceae bacterium]